mmetsp:Transcript_10222/g.20372  ORF Transcript_10222/g.20372 Transcript_10222/m.20372 type:complete len:164 (+) Transcript_10222:647-1138(+)
MKWYSRMNTHNATPVLKENNGEECCPNLRRGEKRQRKDSPARRKASLRLPFFSSQSPSSSSLSTESFTLYKLHTVSNDSAFIDQSPPIATLSHGMYDSNIRTVSEISSTVRLHNIMLCEKMVLVDPIDRLGPDSWSSSVEVDRSGALEDEENMTFGKGQSNEP